MITIVGVRFKKAGKIYYFSPMDLKMKENENVIVETARGIEFGTVVILNKEIDESELNSPLKDIIRIATDEDKEIYKENLLKAKETLKICEEKVKFHDLNMSLVDCEYTFDRNKLIFYFTAEGRIDFRDLVKDLASIFKTRIELRQIGVRDEAKSISGLGACGRKLCCSSWLGDFQPVSIKMAKDQNLSLNPTKISGVCGRLFCCLKYEHDVYTEILDEMPQIGSLVKTNDNKKGVVTEVSALIGQIKVEVDGAIKIYEKEDVKMLKPPRKCCKSQALDAETLKELKKLED
ncbi:MAG: stage 0 sporulation family protein [Peptostreptococcaceae bacterium]